MNISTIIILALVAIAFASALSSLLRRGSSCCGKEACGGCDKCAKHEK